MSNPERFGGGMEEFGGENEITDKEKEVIVNGGEAFRCVVEGVTKLEEDNKEKMVKTVEEYAIREQ